MFWPLSDRLPRIWKASSGYAQFRVRRDGCASIGECCGRLTSRCYELPDTASSYKVWRLYQKERSMSARHPAQTPRQRPGVACSDEDLASLVEDQDEEQVPGKSSSPTCGMMVAVDYEQILLQCRTWRLSCGRKHRALLERSRALKVPDVLRSACSAACLQLATLERRFTRGLTSQMCGLT